MKHIIKNMIPYWRSVLLILLLLVVQAYCDLALPLYTSNIIDVGIQNGGVEHIVPERVTEEEYAMVQLLMTEEEKSLWQSLYHRKDTVYVLQEDRERELSEADETLLVSIVINHQMSHMEEQVFKEYVKQMLRQDEQTKAMADRIDAMTLDEIGQMMQVEIPSFQDSSEDSGNSTQKTYVDMRPVLQKMWESGRMDDRILKESRQEMDREIKQIGGEVLQSMGIQYALACDEAAGMDMHQIQMSYLWREGGLMALLALLMTVSAIAVSFFASRVGAGIGRDLRSKVFSNVMGYSSAEIGKFSSASLITRATNDVQQIQMVSTMMLRMVLYAPIMGIGGVLRVAQTGAGMGWIIVLAVLLLIGFVLLLVAVAMPKFKIMQKMVDAVNLVSREILTGLSVIRAFGREKTEEERFDVANQDLRRTQLFTNRVMTFMMPGMMLLMNLVVVLITWVSAKHIDAGDLQVGTMTAFITYTMQIVMAFLMLTMMSIMLPRAGVAAERIDEVVRTEASIHDPEQPKELKDSTGVVKFEHVSFRYPGAEQDVLHDLNFTARPGQVTAIIGGTGSGKSTLVNLIPRFYDVTEGKITIDGIDIRELALENLRDQIGFVPQKGVLFSGTIASNLRFGKADATDEEIREAAEIAQATEFITEKQDAYDSYIAQGGRNVSGGQKQRLAIARAIARDPEIFVFDDSFSALDMKTDAKLRIALADKVADRTEIIVAQRISTILHADQILVLDEGKIVGQGTHEELLYHCDVYRQIATSQMSAKELGLQQEDTENPGKEDCHE
ncbi:MAG: ABC transporter ATP-binding protein [Eubacteriales bacterium]|nr:ABC transporter ATP-binding protein [Eubacteriales bacterium]